MLGTVALNSTTQDFSVLICSERVARDIRLGVRVEVGGEAQGWGKEEAA